MERASKRAAWGTAPIRTPDHTTLSRRNREVEVLHYEAQKREALIAVKVLNRMTILGMPESLKTMV